MINKFSRFLKLLKTLWKAGGIYKIQLTSVTFDNLLKGKVVLVTGGSAGIGYEIANTLIKHGASVIITGRHLDSLIAAKKSINSSNLYYYTWDVNDIDDIEFHLDKVKNLVGLYPNCLINNAGLLGGHKKIFETTPDDWDKLMTTNLRSVFFLVQHISKFWINNGMTGKIINISSMRGSLGIVDGPYGCSKWSINGLTQGLGLYFASKGIIVNAIAPGIIPTRSINIKNIDIDENAYCNPVPCKRYGHSSEIANLALFLVSDQCNYIIGQTIVCDGGYSLKI